MEGRCAYTTSKGAALMFCKSLAVDYARHGIRSNAIIPGPVYTPLTRARLDDPATRGQFIDPVPLGRPAQPEEIAEAIALLATGRLTYMNGAALVLDGGFTAL
jgi:NAD(P)-dependent dehydrogenase (short-subunit alcohol dehydrogenase family)